MLDIPDNGDDSVLTLGCAGTRVVQFSDNTLIDVSGLDLYVFEIGPDVKATAMATDADSWIRVGSISGGKAVMNIASYVSGDDFFR